MRNPTNPVHRTGAKPEALKSSEKTRIEKIVRAVAVRNRAFISTVEKSNVYSDDVFWQNVEYLGVGESDIQDDIFCDMQWLRPPAKDYDFDFIDIGLRCDEKHRGSIRLLFVRCKSGGPLRLNSIGDVEPED